MKTKTELAESMAGFCQLELHSGLVSIPTGFASGDWVSLIEYFFDSGSKPVAQPKGFFVVWDKVEEMKPKASFMLGFWMDVMGRVYLQKEDRCTALYSVVHEMMLRNKT